VENKPFTQSQQKLNEADELKEQTEALPEWLKTDAHVIVSTNTVQNKRGHVRYIGGTKFGNGLWIGVELEAKFGKNDGSVKGERYFSCPDERGVFVRVDKLSPVVNRVD
jgi:tubulin-folding cofactor B